MIYVSKEQLSQVEYLIQQSSQGNHLLFDQEAIRDVLSFNRENISESDAYSVEHHLERMILQPSLEQKRAYLEALDRATFEKVVRTYFNIVENSLYEKSEIRH